MKKLLGAVLATLLTLTLAPVSVAATVAPKPGSVCKPLGKTVVINAKKYTCVKSGKKLLWSKPVRVAKPTPSPTAAPVEKPTMDNLGAQAVYEFSRASVNEAIAKNGTSSLAVSYFVGPNVSSSTVDSVKPNLLKTMNLWGPAFGATDRISIIWYVQADLAWAASKYVEESGNPVEWSNINGSCTPNFCGNATATNGRTGKFVFEQGMTLDRSGWNGATAGHEFTHLAQGKLAGSNQMKMPLWLLEGGAQFYGEATGYYAVDPNKTIRSGMHKQFAADSKDFVASNFSSLSLKQVLAQGNPSNTAKLMKLIEFEGMNGGRTSLSYLLGSYASEVLVATYGHEKMQQLIKSFATSTDWESNFQAVYGISTATFYEKLTPYLQKMAAEL